MALQRDLRRNVSGLAALEFALLAPFMAVLVYGLIELTLRLRAADEYQRYLQQAGDYLSRESELHASDLDEIYAAATQIMRHSHDGGTLHLDVSSIGYRPDGAPELLWRRYRGEEPPTLDITDANGLGDPGESVLRVSVRSTYVTPISQMVGAGVMNFDAAVYFRPRVTRLIAMDGLIHDAGVDWAGDGSSVVEANNGETAVGEIEP